MAHNCPELMGRSAGHAGSALTLAGTKPPLTILVSPVLPPSAFCFCFFPSRTDRGSSALRLVLQTSVFGSRTAGRPFRRVAGDDGTRFTLSKAEFMEKVQQSNEVCQRGDFQEAVRLYSEALRADPQNCILYSNRSAAFLKLGRHQAALEDAGKACELNPKWPKVRVHSGDHWSPTTAQRMHLQSFTAKNHWY